MSRNVPSSSLIPTGLSVLAATTSGSTVAVTAIGALAFATCPLCKVIARRVHSRYVRHVSDLPCAGRGVRLRLLARRFRCEQPCCGHPADERLAVRQHRAVPLLAELELWMRAERARLSRHAPMAKVMDYMLTRWDGFALRGVIADQIDRAE